MRFGSTVSLLAGAAICLSVGTGSAQDWRVMLQPQDALRLSPEAMKTYNEAVEQVDRINYDEAVRLLAQASEMAPEHTELQFLTATRARNRAEIYYSAARYTQPLENATYSSPPWKVAEPFYEIADQALQRLIAAQDLSAEERRRLENEMERVETGRSSLSTRDEERMNTGLPILHTVRRERRTFLELDQESAGSELDPFSAYTRPRQTAGGTAGPATTDTGFTADAAPVNPFAPLTGEVTKPFLPTPPPPLPPQAMQFDEFGAPIGGQQLPAGDPTISQDFK